MPYKLTKRNNKFCVQNTETGENKGCSDTREMASKHMRALYAAESGDKMGEKEIDMLVKEAEDIFDREEKSQETKEYYDGVDLIYPATSYSELKEMSNAREQAAEINELIYQFPTLASNILASPDIEDKGTAIKSLADELASKMNTARKKELEDIEKAISEREDVSDADKKRAVAEYGKVAYADPKNKKYPVDTEPHIKAAWSYINMPKNAAKYSSSEVAAIKRRIVSAWKRKIDKNGPPQAKKEWEYAVDALANTLKEAAASLFTDKEDSQDGDADSDSLMVWYDKEANRWMWLARYSNNFRDRDNPPEIISADSHRRFVELVDKGLAPYPEYWLWHIKDWNIGKATWLAYDDAGFSLAAGYFNKGCEQVAEWLSKQEDFAVSHGMPPHTIKRDPDDPSIIIEHETREISALPRKFAANLLTDAIAFNKEAEMAIPEEKRKALIENWGMPAEFLDSVEKLNAVTAEKAVEEGLESKEQTETPAGEEVVTEPVTPTEEQPPVVEEEVKEAPVTRQEIADAIVTIVVPYFDEVKALKEQVAALTNQLEKKEASDEERVAEVLKQTPMASLAALINNRVVGNPEAQVDGRSELAKSKPKETQPPQDRSVAGLPTFITSMFTAENKE